MLEMFNITETQDNGIDVKPVQTLHVQEDYSKTKYIACPVCNDKVVLSSNLDGSCTTCKSRFSRIVAVGVHH